MSEEFILAIEEIREDKDVGYLDAILIWCERSNCEVEMAASMVKKDPALLQKLKCEVEKLHLLTSYTANTLDKFI